MSIAREGWPFIGGLLALAALLAWRYPWGAGACFVLGVFWHLYAVIRSARSRRRFPRRLAGDGACQGRAAPRDRAGARRAAGLSSGRCRLPSQLAIAGTIEKAEYARAASCRLGHKAVAGQRAERGAVVRGETRVGFKQIAGLIARSIVSRKHPAAPSCAQRVG